MDDLNDKVTGGTLTATEWNEVPSELQNVIEALGIALSSGDLNQLGKAIAGYVANGTFHTDSGVADAYVLTQIGSKQALTAYTDGAAFEFIAANAGTGAAATVNVAGLGVKNIKLADGTDPASGQIDGRTILRFDSGNDRCELIQAGMVSTTVITVSGGYNPPAGVKSLEFTAIGAGGGGGGVDGQGAGTAAIGGGGGSGGVSVLTTNNIGASYTVTIGAGGSGGAAGDNNGGAGGATSIVSTAVNMIANGGNGGGGDIASAADTLAEGGSGGTASGGDINATGNASPDGRVLSGTIASEGSTTGSFFGGALNASGNNSGVNATVNGAPGSGAGVFNDATNFAGGDGADGIVIIKEFF